MDGQEKGIAELQAAMASGEASALQLTETYLARIAAIDRRGPTLNAVIELNPEALAIAADLDRERRERGPRGPLHGIPVLVKDNIDTGDRMMTTAGSLALEGNLAPEDAGVVARLRRAGAVLLGKTNLSEWAYFRSTRGCSGWSSRGGQTRNPHALDRTPSGSSSGSGVAVAADLCAGAIGTETDGSIVSPASMNGVVGLKPTVGLVGRSGIIPVAVSQDTAGPMARSVADAAALLTAIAGPDPRDPATRDAPQLDYTQFLDEDALRGARLGVARDCFGRHEGADAVIEGAIAAMRAVGADIVDPVEIGRVRMDEAPELRLMLIEIKAGVDAYLAEHPCAAVRSLEEVVAFNRLHADRMMPYFGQELLERAVAEGAVDEVTHREVREACRRAARDEGIDRALREHRLDALVAPTKPPAWTIDPVDGDKRLGGCATPAAMAGYPHVTVPAGAVHGLPIGLSFFAGAYAEPRLIGLAHAFERAVPARVRPRFAASVS
ncbi:MAG: amidase [Deinococcales bacterium]